MEEVNIGKQGRGKTGDHQPFLVRRSQRLREARVTSTQTEWTTDDLNGIPMNTKGARVVTPKRLKRLSAGSAKKANSQEKKKMIKAVVKKKKDSVKKQAASPKGRRARGSSPAAASPKGRRGRGSSPAAAASSPLCAVRGGAAKGKAAAAAAVGVLPGADLSAVERRIRTQKFGEVPVRKLEQGRDAVVWASVGFAPALAFKEFRSAGKAANEEAYQRRLAAHGCAPQVHEKVGSKTIVMDFVNGIPLPKFLKRQNKKPQPCVPRALEDSLVAVFAALEAERFTPNDNNPYNFLVEEGGGGGGRVWRIDFSASKDLKPTDQSVWDSSNLVQLLKDSFVKCFPRFTLEVYKRAPDIPPSMRISAQHNQALAEQALKK